MMTDPIADLLVRIQNAAQRGHETLVVPASKLKGEMLRVLKEEGFITSYEAETIEGHPHFQIRLRYITEGEPMITGMKRVSRPGLRVYVGKRDIGRVWGGMGISILSTSKGLMTDRQCRAAETGGEVLCQVW